MRTIAEFIDAYRSVTYWWHALDEPILWICTRHPYHTDPHVVFAKISLVNRVYRTNAEKGGRNAEWRLATAFVESNVDEVLAPLRPLRRFDSSTIDAVTDAHDRIMEIAAPVTSRWEVSFAAKYLSSHFPKVVPIHDRYSFESAKRLPLSRLHRGSENRQRYRGHCARVLELAEALRSAGEAEPNLKFIDHVLYNPGAVEGQA